MREIHGRVKKYRKSSTVNEKKGLNFENFQFADKVCHSEDTLFLSIKFYSLTGEN